MVCTRCCGLNIAHAPQIISNTACKNILYLFTSLFISLSFFLSLSLSLPLSLCHETHILFERSLLNAWTHVTHIWVLAFLYLLVLQFSLGRHDFFFVIRCKEPLKSYANVNIYELILLYHYNISVLRELFTTNMFIFR